MKPYLCFFLVVTALSLLPVRLHATTFNIANGDVAGLKTAITTANSNAQNDTIELAPGGTYTLTTRDNSLNGLPAINSDGGHSLTIHGSGTTIQRSAAGGTPTFRFFQTNGGATLILSGLNLTNGNPGAFHGGAIYNDYDENVDTTLSVMNCTLSGNSGDYGGAIFNDGYQDPSFPAHTATLIVSNSAFNNNVGTQYGGAIWNESGGILMNVINSTFSGNSASARSAGAIQFDGSSGTANGVILGCTFTQNSASNYGGAINVDGFSGNAALVLANCTFDRNSAAHGGGLASDGTSGNATIYLSNCTFNLNSAATLGGGIYLSTTTNGTTALQITNTILNSDGVSANIATEVFTGGAVTFTSNGYNLSNDAAGGGAGTAPGGFLNHSGDKRNTNPLLDPAGLKSNGGPTQTIALQATSPAVEQGTNGNANDQRGEPRPFDDPNVANASGGNGSDIGAYEADVRIISQTLVGTDLVIVFTSTLGRSYEVQGRPSLLSPTWSSATTTPPAPLSGTGGTIQVTVPNAVGGGASGFYRLHQLP